MAANTNASGAARPSRRAGSTPVTDIASVGAITPIDTATVPSRLSCRRNALRAAGGRAGVVITVAIRAVPTLIRQNRGVKGLSGTRALVTGAASGIGRAVAERLAAEGGRVATLDIAAGAPGELEFVGDVSDEDT